MKAVAPLVLVLAIVYAAPAGADCLNEVAAFSIKICGAIEKSGHSSVVDAKGNLDASINNLIRKIVGGGSAHISGSALITTYDNVIPAQLGSELFNVRDCREKMVKVAVQQACQKPVTYKTCSRREFGQVGWARSDTVEQTSGWVGGGSNPTNWCNELINKTIQGQSIGPDHKATIISKGEQGRWVPIRHREYNYSCKISIQWEPKYATREDPLCGVRSTN